MTARKQFWIELGLAQGLFNIFVFVFAATGAFVSKILMFLTLPLAMFGLPLLMIRICRRIFGEDHPDWDRNTMKTTGYLLGLAALLIPSIIGVSALLDRFVRVYTLETVEFETTAEVAGFFREADEETRLKTAIHLPTLEPLPANQFGHIDGIVGVSTHTSRVPREGTIITTHKTVWPIFAESEKPDESAEFEIHVWWGIDRNVAASKVREDTGWFQFAAEDYSEAVAKALEPEEVSRLARTDLKNPVVVESIRPLADERRFMTKFFWIVFVLGNLFPLVLLFFFRKRQS